ncbi:MAG: hypothetical protein ACTSUE_05545 [Promethearchaeota archaeon]
MQVNDVGFRVVDVRASWILNIGGLSRVNSTYVRAEREVESGFASKDKLDKIYLEYVVATEKRYNVFLP